MVTMSLGLFTCRWLLLCGVLLDVSRGQLEFDQDTVPETSQDITALNQFARYIVDQDRKQRIHPSYFLPFLASQVHKKHRLDYNDYEKQLLLKSLKDKFPLNDRPSKEKLIPWNYVPRVRSTDLTETLPDLIYYEVNPMLEDSKLSYQSNRLMKQRPKYTDIDQASPKQSVYNQEITDKGDKDVATNLFKNNIPSNDGQIMEDDKNLMQPFARLPEFTYYFDNSNLGEKYPFAVKPNDPRYYRDNIFPVDDTNNPNPSGVTVNPTVERENESVKDQTITKQFDNLPDAKNVSVEAFARAEKSEENHPFVVSITHDLNSDMYFIAVIAGCSAAAMFIFVLISLTWCRLQRGVKAAADIEYPAYGVTGPNKDVSPSEDQRLAQSAQMYHFQHQKQQIIAMENRTSATRDPGSLSEAESDEENEEGDYTVYECPGLAATGEMEVKNPLFHDDPTPATPAHTTKNEDHM